MQNALSRFCGCRWAMEPDASTKPGEPRRPHQESSVIGESPGSSGRNWDRMSCQFVPQIVCLRVSPEVEAGLNTPDVEELFCQIVRQFLRELLANFAPRLEFLDAKTQDASRNEPCPFRSGSGGL